MGEPTHPTQLCRSRPCFAKSSFCRFYTGSHHAQIIPIRAYKMMVVTYS
nr:MAG TPA: hypothetical protein [Caudoviricetes sp.]